MLPFIHSITVFSNEYDQPVFAMLYPTQPFINPSQFWLVTPIPRQCLLSSLPTKSFVSACISSVLTLLSPSPDLIFKFTLFLIMYSLLCL